MSQVSEAVKAKRRQHRQDHFTDADRQLQSDYKGDQQGRVAARKEGFGQQGNTSAADFNFDQYGKGHVGQMEVSHLRKQGSTKQDIMSAANASGGELSERTQNRFSRWEDEAASHKQRYTDHFNKIGTSAEDSANLIADYEKNTKDLDPNDAWKALEGGRQFDSQGGDKERYDKIKAGEGKERAQNYTTQHQQMNQNANQDNDVTSTITGDNNTVRIDQDNSVRQYGGVNKSFVYNGSSNGNNYEDTPVSAGTMGGYFHDEDSPGRSAAFVDRYSTMNSDNQKRYKNTGHAQNAINAANKTKQIDVGALDQKINDRAAASRARSTVMAGEIFGDMFNYKPEDWRNADKQEEVETPDFKKLGKI